MFCLRCGNRLAVERRPSSGLLAGLWQLPNTPGLLDERQAGAYASGQGLGDVRLRSARDGRHIFTHIVWTMRCYTLECSAMPPRYHWSHARRAARGDLPADGIPAVCGHGMIAKPPLSDLTGAAGF